MPTYDYKCKACGHTLEIFQSMTESPKRKCPECGKNALERLIGAGAAVIFKGSGFYQTDYRTESYKAGAKAESGESKPAEGAKSDGAAKDAPAKPETPAAKPEPKAEKPKADPKPRKGKDKSK